MKGSLLKSEVLIRILQSPHENPGTVTCACNLSDVSHREVDPTTSAASQCSGPGKLQVPERDAVSEYKGNSTKKWYLRLTSGLHTHAYTCMHTPHMYLYSHVHTHTYAHTTYTPHTCTHSIYAHIKHTQRRLHLSNPISAGYKETQFKYLSISCPLFFTC